jgi:hypothetical protein
MTIGSLAAARIICGMGLMFAMRLPVMAGTYNISFGDAGGLAVRFDVNSTQRVVRAGESISYFENRVSGTITNTMKFPVRCGLVGPAAPTRTYIAGTTQGPIIRSELVSLSLNVIDLRLGPGESKEFSNSEKDSPIDRAHSGIPEWKAAKCITPLVYEFTNRTLAKKLSFGTVTATIGSKQIEVSIENNSSEPIELSWNESSFIDFDRVAKRIFHVGVKYADREQSMPNTIIPPLAKIEDAAMPASNIYFSDEWLQRPLLVAEVPVEQTEKILTQMKGVKVALFLQLIVGGKKTPVTLAFEVSSVKSGK